jgi:hypothetical protein
MNGSANTYVGEQRTKQGCANALPVGRVTTHPRFRPATLPAGGTATLGGAKLMYSRNAFPAIFTDKENNGFLAAILTANNPDELRKLCDERTSLENSRLQNYETYMIITGLRPTDSRSTNPFCLTNDQRKQYDQLRQQRNELLKDDPALNKTDGKDWRWRQFKRISKQLYQLTGHHGYNYGYDT